jgi:hypothetical protein
MIQRMIDVTPPDGPGLQEPGTTVATALDEACYRVLTATRRLQELQAQLETVERDIAVILRRVGWSRDAIVGRDG